MRRACLLLTVVLFLVAPACSVTRGTPVAGGQPERGKHLAAWYGCGSCHEITGLQGATGMVAPPLQRIARRAYITGSVPNTPANMIRWIRDPRGVDARTVMPDMNIPERDARDIAAFLYTLY